MQKLLKQFQKSPVIPAAHNPEAVRRAADTSAAVIFLLGGSILTLPEMIRIAHDNGKRAFVHIDLAEGLGRDEIAVRWLVEQQHADGVISTRPSLLKAASELGAITIQRLFLMDSTSFEHGKRMLRNTPPDMAEVLPGIAPKAIRQLCEALDKPVIAGGLITEPKEIALALQAGASAVSVGDEKLWNLKI
ncbi:MAG: glycerol-3-phosphate responsive antiterminator [Candidatus Faecivicinus sp.]